MIASLVGQMTNPACGNLPQEPEYKTARKANEGVSYFANDHFLLILSYSADNRSPHLHKKLRPQVFVKRKRGASL